MPPSKILPQVFIIIPQADGNCLFLPNSILCLFFPKQKEEREDYVVEKITKINKGIGHKFW